MPANLPPRYSAAEQEYRHARSAAEKLEALETMLAVMPRHKGTEHLRADLRARMAALSAQAERQVAAGRDQLYHVHREGAGQVVLVGLPNCGKSQLLAALTHATPRIADYPFTTQVPQPGMMAVGDVQVQLVDLPPITPGETPGWLRHLIRYADVVLLTLDLSFDPLSEWAMLQNELAALHESREPAPALVVATKADLPGAADNLALLRLEIPDHVPIYAVSGVTGAGLEALRWAVFGALHVVRVYCRPPGQPVDRAHPFVLPRGSTVDDLADAIHHELRAHLRYAAVWGASGRFAGQRVGREHVLEDEDVVELVER